MPRRANASEVQDLRSFAVDCEPEEYRCRDVVPLRELRRNAHTAQPRKICLRTLGVRQVRQY